MWPYLRYQVGKEGGLKYLTLRILKGGPRNGAEIMDAVEKISMGFWRPSPGTVYPLLETLLKSSLIEKMDDGRYRLTQSGEEEVNDHFGSSFKMIYSTDDVIVEMENSTTYLEEEKKSKIEPYRERITLIIKRLEGLINQ
ncbi:MAG: PadR family transcriptional regulator [Nitrososphaerota archaeon]|jgi:DNA-binding PadR family transcriptional regulator|nr:PadR family transcriptional regulator [Nitrososphaerota archaeon]MDG7035206.1 PadR family transcriptional regulator [Nitrososphaerota archaeon]MDG7041079.1 PadR family transcriptional regulator [Nitrososphaerota archaeon]MDG7043657.1 PadR family transcriptional regulator [Nitrososphaerota archaeon]MDG7046634.1 PadR family transcriptional regulator [Nitrososphaerota archaeon]